MRRIYPINLVVFLIPLYIVGLSKAQEFTGEPVTPEMAQRAAFCDL